MQDTRGNHKELALVVITTIVVLLFFSGRAFNFDDPLFIWSAKQILKNPADFYGFNVNWYGQLDPAWQVIKNPPLASYYMALAGKFIGFSERALHIVFILPATLTSIAVYFLAGRLGAPRLPTALIALFTPAFLVSATTVMCDILMLCFFCFAILFWIIGNEDESHGALFVAVVFISLASLTKYFAISLIPLVAVYSLCAGHKTRRWLPWLLLPIAALAFYHFYTDALYGRGLLLDATGYTKAFTKALVNFTGERGTGEKAFIGLVFTGGLTITTLLISPFFLKFKGLLTALAFGLLCAIILIATGSLDAVAIKTNEGVNTSLLIHLTLFALSGAILLALTVLDLINKKNASSVLLLLWIWGTVVFTIFFNWTVNARSLLPLVPAFAILVMRNSCDEKGGFNLRTNPLVYIPIIIGAVISILVATGDASLANTARTAAKEITAETIRPQSRLFFQGHWGFQYYMEEAGAVAFDFEKDTVGPGEIMVMPGNNTNVTWMPMRIVKILQRKQYETVSIVSTMSAKSHAGYYASIKRPVPYLFGPGFKEDYYILIARTGFRM